MTVRIARSTVLVTALLVGACRAAPQTIHAGEGALRVEHGAVSSANEISSRAGVEVLRDGGNAVDAAVAVGLALAVTHPTAGNIGGGGFMVIRFPDGRATAIDFREKAPLASHPEMFLDEKGEFSADIRHRSHISVGVPGTVAGFALAHERYGSLEWARLVEPAVELARDGFKVMPELARSMSGVLDNLERYPASLAAFSKNGTPYDGGEVWRQPDLARTLERIMQQGQDGFYRGETARLLVEEMERGGGLITLEDLERYEAVERETVRGMYRGYEIISMPPPSSGGTALVEMLNVLEGFDLAALGHNTAPYLHHLAETMRLAFRDRARHLADADFVDVPIADLTSEQYAAELRSMIDPQHAGVSSPADAEHALVDESEETTHYSVVDASGLAVSVTYTLEQGYGSKITVPGAGFLLNNQMGDFNAGPGITDTTGLIGTEPNLARPEQRMLSSMSPSIVTRDGQLVAVIGSPGGRTIINTVLQVFLNLVDFGMSPVDAITAPRMHHQWLPNRIDLEEGFEDEALVAALNAMGHSVRVRGSQGTAHSIFIEPGTGWLIAVPDPRGGDAAAAGY
ncbi:MAG: gamma-glutamyltransferase [Gemmatimonadetes bacterium]|nr:gamma-glutamyltransferase [Gemmatimonadota bacterium]